MAEAALEAIARAKAIAAKLNASMDTGRKRGRWDNEPEEARKRKKIYIPRNNPDINFMGLLIGPRGSTQKRMEELSGARILIRGRGSQREGEPPSGHPDDDDELHVAIEGSDDAIAIAAQEVEAILFNPQEAMRLKQLQLRNLAEMNGTLRGEDRGGPGGGGDGGGHYGPPGSGGPPRPRPGLGFGGGGGGGGGGDGHYGPDEEEEDVRVPGNVVGLIIGKGGENIQRMQQRSGCHVQIAKEFNPEPGETMRTVNLRGPRQGIEECKKMIDEIVQSRMQGDRFRGGDRDRSGPLPPADPSQYGCSASLTMTVPNERVGLIIGRAGSTIKGIQEKTGAHINIPGAHESEDPNFRQISITASSHEAAEAAQQEIEAILSSGPGGRPRDGPPGGGAPPQQNSIIMHLPNDKMGMIIGKGGSNIKDLQSRTQTRIHIQPESEPGSQPPMRVITITGTGDAPQRARVEIEQMCANDGRGDRYAGGYPAYQATPGYGAPPPPQHGYYPPPHGYYPPYGGYADPYYGYYAQQQQQAPPPHGAHQAAGNGAPQGGEPKDQQQQQQQKPADDANKPAAGGDGQQQAAANTDPTQYYDAFWQWAQAYGEEYARSQYGAWAPPVGTPPPPGITLPATGAAPAPPAAQQS